MLRYCLIISLLITNVHLSLAQDCYRTFLDQGVQAYDSLDFETAINQFNAAKICDDLPADNEVDEWINKAQNGYINAIKAEQTKSQSLALTAKSILELLKKNNATKAFRYAQQALGKDDSPEARSALYECYYQLEEGDRKSYYVRDIQAFPDKNNSIENAGFLDNGQTIFVFGRDRGVLKLYNLAGQIVAETTVDINTFDRQAYCEATELLLTTETNEDGTLFLTGRTFANGKLEAAKIFSYMSPDRWINSAAISKDGQRIVVGFHNGDTHVLDAQGKLLYELPKEKKGVLFMSFSDEHEIALSYARRVKVFQLNEQRYETMLDTIEQIMYNAKVRLSPKASYLMTGDGRKSNIWDLRGDSTLVQERNLNFQEDIGMFSKDEKYATLGNGLLDMEDRELAEKFPTEVRNMVLSPDSRYLAANIGTNKVRLWRNNRFHDSNFGVLGGHKEYIRQVVFSPDSTHILTASLDNTVKLWNLKMRAAERIWNTGKVLGTFLRNDTTFIGVTNKDKLYFFTQDAAYINTFYLRTQNILAIDPAGKYVFMNVEKGFEIYGLDISQQSMSYMSGISNTDTANMAQFLSDDQVVYYTNSNYTYSLRVWNFKEGGQRYLSGYDTDLISLSCAADQQHVAALDNSGKAYLWRVTKGEAPVLLRSWFPHPDYGCMNITFSRDSKNIITSGYDNVANVWSLEGELELRLVDHLRRVKDADTTPDGQYLLTASHDRTAKVWTRDGELLATLNGYDYPLESAQFSENGQYIITNYEDGTLMIWPFEPSIIIEKVEKYQIPELSAAERGRYD